MELILLLPIAAFSGTFIGVLLAHTSPEEMKPGKKYFNLLEKAILLAAVMGLIAISKTAWPVFLGIAIGFMLRTIHVFLGTALAASIMASPASSLFVASMAFLYGLPEGTRIKAEGEFNLKTMLKAAIFFFAPLLLLLFDIVSTSHILALAAGCIIPTILLGTKTPISRLT